MTNEDSLYSNKVLQSLARGLTPVSFHPEPGFVYVDCRTMSEDKLKALQLQALQLARQNACVAILYDCRQLSVPSLEYSQWVRSVWMDASKEAGILRHAVVMPIDPVSRNINLQRAREHTEALGLKKVWEHRMFDNMEDALAWLEEPRGNWLFAKNAGVPVTGGG